MNEQSMYTLLTSTGLQVAYDHFIETNETPLPTPPFILYRADDPSNFKADDTVYLKDYKYIIDLVTEKKDVAKETQIETLLTNANIPWDKAEDYIETEKIFQIRYFI